MPTRKSPSRRAPAKPAARTQASRKSTTSRAGAARSAVRRSPKKTAGAAADNPPYRRVLVPLDGSHDSFVALREALVLGRRLGATVVAYHLLQSMPAPYFDVAPGALQTHARHSETVRSQMKRYFEKAERLAAVAGVALETVYRKGRKPADGIAAAAKRARCDLIIIRSHGLSALGRLLLGSVTTSLIAVAEVPVLVLPQHSARKRKVR
jgi:nucleotide-binding universal stress UspA family protein